MNNLTNAVLLEIIKQVESNLNLAEKHLKDPNFADLKAYLEGEAHAYDMALGYLQDRLIDDDNL